MEQKIDNFLAKLADTNGFYIKENNGITIKILSKLRKRYSVKEISNLLKVSERTVYSYLNSERTPPVKILLKSIDLVGDKSLADELLLNAEGVFTWGHSSDKLPTSFSADIAYLTGLICGDGHVSKRTEISIPGDSKEFLVNHVSNLFKTCFNYAPVYRDLGTYGKIDIMSKPIHFFFNKVVGHPKGKKKGILRVPSFIFKSDEFKRSFLRGLFDSDGGITYSNGRYSILFSSSTYEFLIQIQNLLKDQGIFIGGPYDSGNHKGFEIRTYKKDTLLKFAKIIGSNHPKKCGRLNALVA